MKSDSTNQAVRLIVAALSNSQMSPEHLREFSDALATDRQLVANLSRIIAMLAGPAHEQDGFARADIPLAEYQAQLVDIAKARHLTRRSVIAALRSIGIDVRGSIPAQSRQSVPALIQEILPMLSHERLVAFRSALLSIPPDEDEYLKGIMTR